MSVENEIFDCNILSFELIINDQEFDKRPQKDMFSILQPGKLSCDNSFIYTTLMLPPAVLWVVKCIVICVIHYETKMHCCNKQWQQFCVITILVLVSSHSDKKLGSAVIFEIDSSYHNIVTFTLMKVPEFVFDFIGANNLRQLLELLLFSSK